VTNNCQIARTSKGLGRTLTDPLRLAGRSSSLPDGNTIGYKILFPVDFSSRSVLAAQHVKMWSEHFGAVLNALHIVDNPGYGSRAVAWRTADLELFCQYQFGEDAARAVVLAGSRADALESFVNRERIDLVMLPRNHRSLIDRLFGDSIAAILLERCRASVWMTEHLKEDQAVTVNHVLCAMHFKQDTMLDAQHIRILKTVRQLALTFEADVTFLQVAGNAKSDESWCAEGTKAGSHSWLAQAQDILGGPIRLLKRPGNVISGIRDAAGQIGADLVVVGRMRPEAISFGQQSRILKIDHAVRCPVLSVW
jgi:nucleotide-binding universal stress UspA family protein